MNVWNGEISSKNMKLWAQCVTKVINSIFHQCGQKCLSYSQSCALEGACVFVEPEWGCVVVSSARLLTIVLLCLSLWSLFSSFIIKTHRYIPLPSSGGLIRKALAIPQDLPQDLTNLLSYVFVTSRTKQLIALFFQFRAPIKPNKCFFTSLIPCWVRADFLLSLSLFHCWPECVCRLGGRLLCPYFQCHCEGYSRVESRALCLPWSSFSGSFLRWNSRRQDPDSSWGWPGTEWLDRESGQSVRWHS